MSSPPPSTPQAHLTNLHTLLASFHHRNKNQHRLSKWYKHFSLLRRSIPKLIISVNAHENARMLSDKENKYIQKARGELRERVEFIGEWVVGGGWFAFSHLVADNQYSNLGLFLIACLAQFQQILKDVGKDIGVEFEEVDDVEVPIGGQMSGSFGSREDEGKDVGEDRGKEGGGDGDRRDDFGEVVERSIMERERDVGRGFGWVEGEGGLESENEAKKKASKGKGKEVDEVLDSHPSVLDEDEGGIELKTPKAKKRKSAASEKQKSKPMDSTPAKRPKKKRKKGDAFDDLFDSLL